MPHELHKETLTKFKNSAELTLADLEVFGTYAWLLTDSQRSEVAAMTKAVLKDAGKSKKRGSASSASAPKKAKKEGTGPSKASAYFN